MKINKHNTALILLILMILSLLSSCYNLSNENRIYKKDSFSYTVQNNEIHIVRYEGVDESVVIPETLSKKKVTFIGDYAFKESFHVTDISIPDTIRNIGFFAFSDTAWYLNLTEEFVIVGDGVLIKCNQKSVNVDIPESVKSLSYTFYGYKSDIFTAYITLPSGLNKIDDYAFFRAHGNFGPLNLENIEVIGKSAFENSSFNNLLISDKLKEIQDRAFANSDISRISADKTEGYHIGTDKIVFLPFSVKLGTDIFEGVKGNMDTVKFEDDILSITAETTENLSGFKKFFIPEKQIHIDSDAFNKDSVLYVVEGGYVEAFAKENGFTVEIIPDFTDFKDVELMKLVSRAMKAALMEFTYENIKKVSLLRIVDQVEGNPVDEYKVFVIVNTKDNQKGIDLVVKENKIHTLDDLALFTSLEYLDINTLFIIDEQLDCSVLSKMPALEQAYIYSYLTVIYPK